MDWIDLGLYHFGLLHSQSQWEAYLLFHSGRGLRRGDAPSPLLSVLVSYVLNRFWSRVEEAGLIAGFQVRNWGTHISHLQYADDAILFFSEGKEQLLITRFLLKLLEEVSGLKVNFHKNQLLGIHMEDHSFQREAFILGCQIGQFPIPYLGLPLIDGAISSKTGSR